MAQGQGLLGHPVVDVARLSSFLLDTKYGGLPTLCSYSGRIDTDTVQGAREGGEAVFNMPGPLLTYCISFEVSN